MANEIQTITVPDFVGAMGFLYIAIGWPEYLPGDQPIFTAGTTESLEGLSAAQAAAHFEDVFNTEVALQGRPDGTVSVTGAIDGTSLVLTVEFDGPDVAGTDVEQGYAEDWDGVGEPVIATVQDGGPSATAPAAIDDLAATPGANKLTFTYSQPDDGGSTITTQTLKLAVNCVQRVTFPGWLGAGGGYILLENDIASAEADWDGVSASGLATLFQDYIDTALDPDKIAVTVHSASEPVVIQFEFIGDLSKQFAEEFVVAAVDTDNGTPAIATITAGGPTVYATGVSSPHEVTGLTGGVASGPWTVTSTNAIGESDPSNAVTETPDSPATGIGHINLLTMGCG
jgi:hypothetical protein